MRFWKRLKVFAKDMAWKPIWKQSPEILKKKERQKVQSLTDTKTVSFQLYKAAKDIASIAKERNLSISTIEGHLSFFVGTGEIDINELVDKKKQKLIHDAAAKHGIASHKTLIDNLPKDINYGELRMVLAAGDIKAE